MLVVGIDPHKQTHTAVMVDGNGRQLATLKLAARPHGHGQLLAWAATTAAQYALTDTLHAVPQVLWAVEDCRHVSSMLLADLAAAGVHIVLVPPAKSAALRAAGRRGKSDPIDALAIARAALAIEDLPVYRPTPAEQDLRALVEYREHLVRARTKEINRARWLLHKMDPDLQHQVKNLTGKAALARVTTAVTTMPASIARRVLLDTLEQIRVWNEQIKRYEKDITQAVTPIAPALMSIVGVGALGAAKIIGEVAGIDRFSTARKLAMYAGTAPIPVSSGKNDGRYRLNRGGERQLNAAIHIVAITQSRCHDPAKTLIARHLERGRTKKGALRVLKRHLTNAIHAALKADYQRLQHAQTASIAIAA